MIVSILKIGNSQGIILPKALLETTGLGPNVQMTVEGNEIKLSQPLKADAAGKLTREVLQNEWSRPEEEKAWSDL